MTRVSCVSTDFGKVFIGELSFAFVVGFTVRLARGILADGAGAGTGAGAAAGVGAGAVVVASSSSFSSLSSAGKP